MMRVFQYNRKIKRILINRHYFKNIIDNAVRILMKRKFFIESSNNLPLTNCIEEQKRCTGENK